MHGPSSSTSFASSPVPLSSPLPARPSKTKTPKHNRSIIKKAAPPSNQCAFCGYQKNKAGQDELLISCHVCGSSGESFRGAVEQAEKQADLEHPFLPWRPRSIFRSSDLYAVGQKSPQNCRSSELSLVVPRMQRVRDLWDKGGRCE